MAVYTEIADHDLLGFLANYDLGGLLSLKGIAEGVQNSNFLLHTQGGYFILTLYEKLVNADDLPFFIGLMEHLSRAGITCPQPVKNRAGENFGTLAGRPAAIVTFLDGMWPRRPDSRQCGGVGEALARMHEAGRDFPLKRPNALALADWEPLFASVESRAEGVMPGMTALVRDELAFLHRNWPKNLPFGVIHADLFPDNVFFIGQDLSGLIDFYFACNDAFAYDLAICLNAWCFEPDASFNLTKGMAMLNGYAKVRALEPAEIGHLAILARGAALRFLLTRLVDWLNVPQGAMVRPKDPSEYVKKLRFHQRVNDPREYGLPL